jgi:hypothetical protein
MGTSGRFFKHGNELSGTTIKCGELLEEVRNSQLFKKDPAPWSE